MLRIIGKQPGESVESVLKKKRKVTVPRIDTIREANAAVHCSVLSTSARTITSMGGSRG